MYLANSPFWLQWLYPTLTWHKSRREKFVYLTFDDGPVPVVTPFVLNTLKKFDALATFFCIGDNIDKFPGIYSDILDAGHSVGNHTYNHLRGWDTKDAEYLSNVKKCSELTGSRLFRPPYGRIKKSQISSVRDLHPDIEIVMWDVLSGDFDESISAERCFQNVMKNTKNGSIIVFHDSHKAFRHLEHILPRILEQLRQEGYSFKLL